MSLSKTYHKLLREQFLLVQSVQTALLMATGDIISQQLIEKRGVKNQDIKRTIQFASIGLFFVGPALTTWFKFLARIYGHEQTPSTVIKKVATDQTFFAPPLLFTVVSLLGLMQGDDMEKLKIKLRTEYIDIMKTNYKLWPAVQLINFSFVPLRYQVLLVQTVAVIWNTYLSWKTKKE